MTEYQVVTGADIAALKTNVEAFFPDWALVGGVGYDSSLRLFYQAMAK